MSIYNFIKYKLNRPIGIIWSSPKYRIQNINFRYRYFITFDLLLFRAWKEIEELDGYDVVNRIIHFKGWFPIWKFNFYKLYYFQHNKLSSEAQRLMDFSPAGWDIFVNNLYSDNEFDKCYCYPEYKRIHVTSNSTYGLIHEMGHAWAELKGLDMSDEKLAWTIAEEIWKEAFNENPPQNFYDYKIYCLRSYNIEV